MLLWDQPIKKADRGINKRHLLLYRGYRKHKKGSVK